MPRPVPFWPISRPFPGNAHVRNCGIHDEPPADPPFCPCSASAHSTEGPSKPFFWGRAVVNCSVATTAQRQSRVEATQPGSVVFDHSPPSQVRLYVPGRRLDGRPLPATFPRPLPRRGANPRFVDLYSIPAIQAGSIHRWMKTVHGVENLRKIPSMAWKTGGGGKERRLNAHGRRRGVWNRYRYRDRYRGRGPIAIAIAMAIGRRGGNAFGRISL